MDEDLRKERASMRPQLIAADNAVRPPAGHRGVYASMRPQLIAADNVTFDQTVENGLYASMRPQLIAADNGSPGTHAMGHVALQ